MALQIMESKILIGKKDIMDFIQIKSDQLFINFVKKGLPAIVIESRWYAHADNIEEYFKRITKKKRQKNVVK